jgi:acyl carrier protein
MPVLMGDRQMMDAAGALTKDQIYAQVKQILQEKVRGVDAGLAQEVTESTRVMTDLDLESVTIVEFCMAIGKHFRKKFPFQELVFRDGQFQDFTLGELVTFLDQRLS